MLGRKIRFLLIGGASTIVHVVTAFMFHHVIDLGVQVSNFAGFSVAFMLSFVGHQRYTFKVKDRQAERVFRFFFASILGLSASSLVLFIVTTLLNYSMIIGLALVILIVPVITYLVSLLWVFRVTSL